MTPSEVDCVGEMQVLTFRVRTNEENTRDHEKRLRKLEKVIWVSIGAASVMSMLGSMLGRFLTP